MASSLTAGGYTANRTSYQSVNLKIAMLILKFYIMGDIKFVNAVKE